MCLWARKHFTCGHFGPVDTNLAVDTFCSVFVAGETQLCKPTYSDSSVSVPELCGHCNHDPGGISRGTTNGRVSPAGHLLFGGPQTLPSENHLKPTSFSAPGPRNILGTSKQLPNMDEQNKNFAKLEKKIGKKAAVVIWQQHAWATLWEKLSEAGAMDPHDTEERFQEAVARLVALEKKAGLKPGQLE